METERSAADLVLAWRKLIYRATLTAAIVSVVVSLLMPNWYEATSTCMPPEEGESRGGLLSMFSQVGMDFGAAGLLSATPQTDSMIGVLKSRRVRGQVVDRFDLTTVYRAKTREHAINDLGGHLIADTTPEGFVEVRVEDRDKERAAALANAFMEFLDDYHRLTSVERATRTRVYVETALVENGQRLDMATEALKDFQTQHMAIDLTEQTRVTVDAVAALETERTRLQLERGVLEGFSGPGEMRMRQIDAEIRELEGKLAEVTGTGERDSAMGSGDSGAVIPLSEIPGLAYRLADLTRDVIVLEKVRAFLGSQLEDARIQETRDLEVVQVLDQAVPPVKKSRPRRSLIVILTTGLAFLASIGVSFLVGSLLEYSARTDASLGLGSSGPSRLILSCARRLKEWGGPDEGEGGSASAGS